MASSIPLAATGGLRGISGPSFAYRPKVWKAFVRDKDRGRGRPCLLHSISDRGEDRSAEMALAGLLRIGSAHDVGA